MIRDNDSRYIEAFDTVFESEGIHIIRTPFQAPNATAERWVRSVREESLDKLLVLNEAHLYRVLTEYLAYYNTRRSHQSLEQQSPIARQQSASVGLIQKHKILGGIINDYFRFPDRSSAPKPA